MPFGNSGYQQGPPVNYSYRTPLQRYARRWERKARKEQRRERQRYRQSLRDIQQGNAQQQAAIGGIAQQQLGELNAQFGEIAGNAQQNLVNRGLTGSTVAPSVMAGVERQRARATGSLLSPLAQQMVGAHGQAAARTSGIRERFSQPVLGPDPWTLGAAYGAGGGGGGFAGMAGQQIGMPGGTPLSQWGQQGYNVPNAAQPLHVQQQMAARQQQMQQQQMQRQMMQRAMFNRMFPQKGGQAGAGAPQQSEAQMPMTRRQASIQTQSRRRRDEMAQRGMRSLDPEELAKIPMAQLTRRERVAVRQDQRANTPGPSHIREQVRVDPSRDIRQQLVDFYARNGMDFNNLSPEMQQQRIEQTRQQYLVQAQQEMDRLRQGLDPGTVLTQDNLPAGQSSSRDIVTGWSGYRSPGGIASAGENMPRPSFNETSHQYPASFGQGMMGPYGGMSGPAMPNYAAQQLNQWTQERERYNAALRSGTGYLPKPGVIKPKKRKDTTMKQFDAWSRSNRPKVPATRQVPTGWNTRR